MTFCCQISILQGVRKPMKLKFYLILLVSGAIALSIAGIYYENYFMEQAGKMIFVFPLFGYYYKRLPARNPNLYGFLICMLAAVFFTFFQNIWYFDQISMGLWMGSFIFLIREAVQTTQYRRGTGFMLLYFLFVVGVYGYLLSLHIVEIEANVTDNYLFSTYVIYYVNLLIFGVAALVYYLNSFSRKSVFFICLTLSFIFADVLRDMGVIYFKDLSVEIVGTLIKFAALKLVFLFFVTKEKKLRLLNLV